MYLLLQKMWFARRWKRTIFFFVFGFILFWHSTIVWFTSIYLSCKKLIFKHFLDLCLQWKCRPWATLGDSVFVPSATIPDVRQCACTKKSSDPNALLIVDFSCLDFGFLSSTLCIFQPSTTVLAVKHCKCSGSKKSSDPNQRHFLDFHKPRNLHVIAPLSSFPEIVELNLW